jgi:hypothetical protein
LDHVEPFSVGVMRSLDGGLTWHEFGTDQLRDFTISRIVVDKADSNHLLAAAGRGSRLPGGNIFRSTDAGASWGSVGLLDANWDDLDLCDSTFWAAARHKNIDSDTEGLGGLLYRSSDGIQWTKVNLSTGSFNLDTITPLPDTIQLGCRSIGSGILKGTIVFAAVYLDDAVRIFATNDQGATWTEATATPLMDVKFDPWAHAAFGVTANRLYVGGVFLKMGSLSSVVSGGQVTGTLTFTSVGPTDVQCVVPDPTETDAVFICRDKGLYRFSPRNGLTSLNDGLGVTQVFRMDVHPKHGGLFAGGAQDLGDFVSFFGQGSDATATRGGDWQAVSGFDGRSVAFKGDNTSVVYVANSSGEVKRYDGGTATTDLLDGPDAAAPLVYGSAGNILDYADTAFKEFVNPDSGTNTSPVTIQFRTPAPKTIQSLAVCPTDSRFLYAATIDREFFFSKTGGQVPPTGGKAWNQITTSDSGLPTDPIWAIAPSSANCNDVLVAVGYEAGIGGAAARPSVARGTNTFSVGTRLFRKTDVTASGKSSDAHGTAPSALPFAPLYAILRHPSAPDSTWFVAGDVGVFRTDDAGAHWTNATVPLGLPNTLVRDLRLSADGSTLYAGTFGRGIWSVDVNRPASNVFGVRGIVTQASAPVDGATVSASGLGRIKKFLTNTLISGFSVTTAPINIAANATISSAAATLVGSSTLSVSLIAPNGTVFPMISTGVNVFQLTSASAAALVGQNTTGAWRFRLTGITLTLLGGTIRLNPALDSASVDFQFTNGVSTTTGSDGEYTIEYLTTGLHTLFVNVAGSSSRSINLVANRINVNFAVAPVGVSVL